MRLIDVKNYEVYEFHDDKIRTHAIVSHRWEDDEVTIQDMQRLRLDIGSSDEIPVEERI